MRKREHITSRQLDIVQAMEHRGLFAQWFPGNSWRNWKAILRGAFALPMTAEEVAFFRSVAERDPPPHRVKELWIVGGRRGGKGSIASLIVAHAAVFFHADYDVLRPGERALVQCLAVDRDQSKVILGYIKSYFDHLPPLRQMVSKWTSSGFELSNDVEVAISTNSFRAGFRGRTGILCSIFDECAFWQDETSSKPDQATYDAVTPGLVTLPGSMLVGISSPYRKAGLLYSKFRKHFGKNDPDVLVIRAPSILLNPTLDRTVIDAKLEDDPAAGSAEWLAQFRDDVAGYIARETAEACVVSGRHELPPHPGAVGSYRAFVDPSGGSWESMTLSIVKPEGQGRVVVVAVRERRPPFGPDGVVAEFAELLLTYGIRSVVGDHYAGEWPRERFLVHGIRYEAAAKAKSDLYRDLLPLINSGRVELLDHPRLISQLCGLERRTARSGKDSIDHAPGAHDDLINAVAGAVGLVAGEATRSVFSSPVAQSNVDDLIAMVRSGPRTGVFHARGIEGRTYAGRDHGGHGERDFQLQMRQARGGRRVF